MPCGSTSWWRLPGGGFSVGVMGDAGMGLESWGVGHTQAPPPTQRHRLQVWFPSMDRKTSTLKKHPPEEGTTRVRRQSPPTACHSPPVPSRCPLQAEAGRRGWTLKAQDCLSKDTQDLMMLFSPASHLTPHVTEWLWHRHTDRAHSSKDTRVWTLHHGAKAA